MFFAKVGEEFSPLLRALRDSFSVSVFASSALAKLGIGVRNFRCVGLHLDDDFLKSHALENSVEKIENPKIATGPDELGRSAVKTAIDQADFRDSNPPVF